MAKKIHNLRLVNMLACLLFILISYPCIQLQAASIVSNNAASAAEVWSQLEKTDSVLAQSGQVDVKATQRFAPSQVDVAKMTEEYRKRLEEKNQKDPAHALSKETMESMIKQRSQTFEKEKQGYSNQYGFKFSYQDYGKTSLVIYPMPDVGTGYITTNDYSASWSNSDKESVPGGMLLGKPGLAQSQFDMLSEWDAIWWGVGLSIRTDKTSFKVTGRDEHGLVLVEGAEKNSDLHYSASLDPKHGWLAVRLTRYDESDRKFASVSIEDMQKVSDEHWFTSRATTVAYRDNKPDVTAKITAVYKSIPASDKIGLPDNLSNMGVSVQLQDGRLVPIDFTKKKLPSVDELFRLAEAQGAKEKEVDETNMRLLQARQRQTSYLWITFAVTTVSIIGIVIYGVKKRSAKRALPNRLPRYKSK